MGKKVKDEELALKGKKGKKEILHMHLYSAHAIAFCIVSFQ